MPANEGAAARLPLYLVRLDWHLLTPVLGSMPATSLIVDLWYRPLAAQRFVIEFGLYRSLQGAGAKLRRCKYSRQGSEIGRARVLVRHRLPGRVVLPGRADRTGAVMPDLRETAILEDPLQGQEKGGAVFHLSLRLAGVHQE